jgi:hypothetical protein
VRTATTDEGIRNEVEWTKSKNGSRTDRTRVVKCAQFRKSFVDKVLDVRRTPTANQEVEKEGEALQFGGSTGMTRDRSCVEETAKNE